MAAEETGGFIQTVVDQLSSVRREIEKIESNVEQIKGTLTDLRIASRDVSSLRERTDAACKGTEDTRLRLSDIEREFAVYKTSTGSQITVNTESIKDIAEKLKWLSRLVLGSLITGIIGGILALVFKSI